MPDCKAKDVESLTEGYCEEEDEDEVGDTQRCFYLPLFTSALLLDPALVTRVSAPAPRLCQLRPRKLA
jgi:hypothetical protein